MCCSDREYPRLGQMIVDYENPLKKMMEEFVPHGKVGELCLCVAYCSESGFVKKKKKEASPALTNELVCLIYDPQLDIICLVFVFSTSCSLCQMRCSVFRWSTPGGTCPRTSGGTLSCSLSSLPPPLCSILLSQTL